MQHRARLQVLPILGLRHFFEALGRHRNLARIGRTLLKQIVIARILSRVIVRCVMPLRLIWLELRHGAL